MDAFARGLKIAAEIRKDGVFDNFMKSRYASWSGGIGAKIEAGSVDFSDLESYINQKGGEAAPNESGRAEMLENYLNEYLR